MDIDKIKQEVIKRFDKQFELYSQFALRECLAEFIEKEIEEAYEAGKKEVMEAIPEKWTEYTGKCHRGFVNGHNDCIEQFKTNLKTT